MAQGVLTGSSRGFLEMLDQSPDNSVVTPARFGAFDSLLPAAMAKRAEETGARKCAMDPVSLLVLAVLAGAFISFGAIFATTVSSGNIVGTIGPDGAKFTASLPYGIMRLVTGVVFSVGLILVVVGGAELFTGNNLIVIAWASGRVRTRDVLANWLIAFAGNSLGAGLTAVLMFFTTQYTFGGGGVGLTALSIAKAKVELGVVPAFALGVMCNTLVCLAVWMCYSARTTAGRIITIVPPIAAFVAAGFEHSIANVYFLTIALLIKDWAPDTFWQAINRSPADFGSLTWTSAGFENLLPVTLGNIIGGSVMVAAVYWFIYLRGAIPPEVK
jgi:formate/nitrite transporter